MTAACSFRAILLPVWVILALPCSRAQSQSAPAAPAQFEVATIKPNPACSTELIHPPVTVSGGRLNIGCTTLAELIRVSYAVYADGVTVNLHARKADVSAGPAWVRSDYYAIQAKAEGATPPFQMLGPMTRALIEDRFKLRVHRTEKVIPVYLLSVAKGGPKLQRSIGGECTAAQSNAPPDARSTIPAKIPRCGERYGFGRIEVRGMSMNLFAPLLGMRMDHDVIDMTGLEGQFDFRLEFSPDSSTPGFNPRGSGPGPTPTAPDIPALPTQPTGPSIFTALEEQLGLKLQQGKGTAEVLVIDQVERPAEN